jgi:cobalt-zinc-cadmium efflux system protein
MGHHHHHDHHGHHHHGHHHGEINHNRAFAIGVGLNSIYVVIEFLFGLWSHSLALMADAGHNLGDVLGLLLAWGATVLVKRSPSKRRTYGMRRASILAALLNAGVLLFAVGAISWEALHRLWNPEPVATTTIMIVASIGIVINTATALLFVSGRKNDINIQGAFLHMAADAAVSLGVVLAAALIYLTSWQWLDPVIGLLIVAVIAWSTWGLLRESLDLVMDAVPSGIDPDAIREYLKQLDGVVDVHDLHIWAMSTTEAALTVHLVKSSTQLDDAWLSSVCKVLHDQFGIEHATIQQEQGDPNHKCSRC